MMDCLDYVFYRINKFYIKYDWYGTAFIIICAVLGFWSCSFIFILFGLVGLKLSSKTEVMILYIVSFLGNLFFFHKRYETESFYKQLCKKYNQETNAKLKGWGVFLFIIISILFYMFGLYVEFTQFFRVPIR